jgi:putative aldouronate transport system substrate-binding protein
MKKILAVLTILLMTATLAFATGGWERENDTSSKVPEKTTWETDTPGNAPVKITVELFNRGTDGGRTQADNNAWTQWIKEKVLKDLNIDINFFLVGRFSEETEIVTLMASGSAPDLCYTYNQDMIAQYRDSGGILDLAPYVDRLLPDMKNLLDEDPAISGMDFIYRDIMPDGKMYSIPSYRVALAQRNTFIRKDWLDKLGLPLPKTTQEFYNALVAFRDKDPGNVGRDNVIPYGQDDDTRWGLSNIIRSFVDPNMSDRDRYVYIAAERYFAFPGYKEGVRLINQWYNEGLIYRDFAQMKRTTSDFANLLKTGRVGAFGGNWDYPYRTDYKILDDLRRNVPGADLVPVDCFQSSDGIAHKDLMDKQGLRIFVPSNSKNPEAALKYLNWLCIRENYHFLQVGREGVNHNIVNGVPSIIARPANDPWFQNSSQNIDFTMPINGVEMGSPELNARVLAFSYPGIPPDVIVNAYHLATANAFTPVVVNVPTFQGGIYGTTLLAKGDVLLAQSITAPPADFDRTWDTLFADWMRSGGQAIIDERAAIAETIWP